MTSNSVFERQNQPQVLALARAFRRRYAIARGWRLLRLGVGLVIGTGGVALALLEPSTGEYISAIAAAWIVLSRTVFDKFERRERRCGALAQELFDAEVFVLPWSFSAVGDRPAPEDVRNWGRHQSEEGLRDWYADARPARYPVDVLLSQRSIITWARQDHVTYAHVLRWAAGLAFLLTIAFGLVLDLSLAEYLLRLGLPVLPSVLDVLDIAQANAEVAAAKTRLENQADSLLDRARTHAVAPSVAECRELQDGIFATRLLPGVPNWMYRLTRSGRQENMDEVVRGQVQQLPATLRLE